MRRESAILLLVFIATGIALVGASLLLPYPAVDVARMMLFFYLAASVVLFLGGQFLKGLRQGLHGEEAVPAIHVKRSAAPPPARRAPQWGGYSIFLQVACGVAFILSVVLGLTREQQLAAGLFALSLVL